MIKVLNTSYPDAEIDFMVKKNITELIADYPNITNIIGIEKVRLNEIKNICENNHYDIVILVKPEFKIALALFLARVKFRLGTAYRWYSFLFNLKHKQHRKYSIKHESQYNLDLLEEIDCNNTSAIKSELTVKEDALALMQNRFSQLGVDKYSKKIIVHIPTRGSALTWSNDNFIELIDLLTERGDYAIILTAAENEKSLLNSVYHHLENQNHIYQFTDLSLQELSSLIKSVDLFISNSTGPIHIAAAVGCFCIGFYSPKTTERSIRWAPLTDKKFIFELDEKQNNIKAQKVFNYIIKLLNK